MFKLIFLLLLVNSLSTIPLYLHDLPNYHFNQTYNHDSLRDGVEILEVDYNLTTVEKKTAISGNGNCHKSLGNKVRPEGFEPSTH